MSNNEGITAEAVKTMNVPIKLGQSKIALGN